MWRRHGGTRDSRGSVSRLPGADARLIAAVRARSQLYDAAHPRYSDHNAKRTAWKKIGEELKASPSACKARWNNIRDNYRKSLLRRAAGSAAHAHSYKYTHMLVFLNKFFKSKDVNEHTEAGDEDETVECINEDFEDDEMSENDHDQLLEETNDTVFPTIKEIKSEVGAERQESVRDYEYFGKRESVSSAPSLPVYGDSVHAVDAFLAGLSPTLKAMAPVHLSLAKAEIFAVVHKYEMKGLLEGDGLPKDVNPLPE